MRYYDKYSYNYPCAVTYLTPREIYMLGTFSPEEYAEGEPIICTNYHHATSTTEETLVSPDQFRDLQNITRWDVIQQSSCHYWSDHLERGNTYAELAQICCYYWESKGCLPKYIELVPHTGSTPYDLEILEDLLERQETL